MTWLFSPSKWALISRFFLLELSATWDRFVVFFVASWCLFPSHSWVWNRVGRSRETSRSVWRESASQRFQYCYIFGVLLVIMWENVPRCFQWTNLVSPESCTGQIYLCCCFLSRRILAVPCRSRHTLIQSTTLWLTSCDDSLVLKWEGLVPIANPKEEGWWKRNMQLRNQTKLIETESEPVNHPFVFPLSCQAAHDWLA